MSNSRLKHTIIVLSITAVALGCAAYLTVGEAILTHSTEPVEGGIYLDTLLVTFNPGTDKQTIDAVETAIHGTVTRFDKEFNTYVFSIPVQKNAHELFALASYVKQFRGVKYVNVAKDTYGSNGGTLQKSE